MLILRRQQVIRDAEQPLDRDAHTRFFVCLANRAILNCFEEIDFAAENAPAACFRRRFAQRQQNTLALINEQNPRANARLQNGSSVRSHIVRKYSTANKWIATDAGSLLRYRAKDQ